MCLLAPVPFHPIQTVFALAGTMIFCNTNDYFNSFHIRDTPRKFSDCFARFPTNHRRSARWVLYGGAPQWFCLKKRRGFSLPACGRRSAPDRPGCCCRGQICRSGGASSALAPRTTGLPWRYPGLPRLQRPERRQARDGLRCSTAAGQSEHGSPAGRRPGQQSLQILGGNVIVHAVTHKARHRCAANSQHRDACAAVTAAASAAAAGGRRHRRLRGVTVPPPVEPPPVEPPVPVTSSLKLTSNISLLHL